MPTAAWLLLAALAAAEPPTRPAPPAPPHEVQGVTVSPVTAPPRLTESFPAEGQAIAPGVLVLKLTFDQKMLAGGFDITAAPNGEAPACLKAPRLLNDGKSFVLLCTTAPGKSYALALNAGAQEGFANVGRTRAAPATLTFSTTTGDPVRKLDEAMKVANLDPRLDIPIETAPTD